MTKKLTLTKRQAIEECKELWAEIEASGLSKDNFLSQTEAGRNWHHRRYFSSCPLCHYSKKNRWLIARCQFCPLVTRYGKVCFDLGFHNFSMHEPRFLEAIKGL